MKRREFLKNAGLGAAAGAGLVTAVQAGTVELGHTATYYYFGKDPTFALGTAVCFGMNTRQQNAWWYFGGGSEAMAPLFKEYGCIALLSGHTGCQMGGWFRKETKSVADLKGMKMRIGGMAGLVLAKLGVVPQLICAPIIYPALEKCTIDAAEWVGPYVVLMVVVYTTGSNFFPSASWFR